MTPKDFIAKIYSESRDRILSETPLPDFKEKHLFVARMRIVLFVFTWVMFFIFYPEIWSFAPLPPLVFNIGFFCTALCYWQILRDQDVFQMVLVEMFSDVVSQTTILYVLGLDSTAAFLFYGLYVAGSGSLFGFYAGVGAAAACFACYAALFALVGTGLIPAFHYPAQFAGLANAQGWRHAFNFFMLPVALGFVVYGLRIMSHFSGRRQRALERRHVQLTALNNIGAMIRKALNINAVIDQVLKAVTKGLRFEVCVLALVDKEREKLKFYVAEENYYARKIQEILGVRFADLELPLFAARNAAVSAIDRKRVVIRNSFMELTHDLTPQLNVNKCLVMQAQLGFKKFVMTPLIAEGKGIGVIIGASTSDYIEDTVIDTLDNFANQAALAIESAQLFGEIEERNRELIRANQVKSEFLAIMSHELRTPLIAVIGYSEILIDRIMGDLNGDQMNSVKEVLRNAQNLLELINSILDLAKIEAGKMELNVDCFSLTGLAHDVHKTVIPLLAKKNHRFSVRVPHEKMPELVGDSVKVRQILINLIGNAIKFTEADGQIEVFMEYHPRAGDILARDFPHEERVPELADRQAFTIEVKDSGIGIRPEDVHKIFDVFSQVDVSYTRTHEGTGLGLALTKQLVLLHGGLITVASEYGKGTRFKILLPQGGLPAEIATAKRA
jgi:signal transduction histidine kinase